LNFCAWLIFGPGTDAISIYADVVLVGATLQKQPKADRQAKIQTNRTVSGFTAIACNDAMRRPAVNRAN